MDAHQGQAGMSKTIFKCTQTRKLHKVSTCNGGDIEEWKQWAQVCPGRVYFHFKGTGRSGKNDVLKWPGRGEIRTPIPPAYKQNELGVRQGGGTTMEARKKDSKNVGGLEDLTIGKENQQPFRPSWYIPTPEG